MKKKTQAIQMILLLPVLVLFQNCGSFMGNVDGSLSSSSISFKCTDESQTSPTKSLLLSKLQLSNAIQDLFGRSVYNDVSGALSAVAPPINDSTTNERKSLVSSSDITSYSQVAQAVASAVVANQSVRENVFGTCTSQSAPSANCIDQFLDSFASRILRRPINQDERVFAKNLANSGGDYQVNLESVLSYFLQSPYFLWRIELGEGDEHSSERTYLSQYEIASRISFATTDSIPDDKLFSAAKNNLLRSMNEIRKHTERLLKTPRGQDKITQMVAWWVQADQVKDLSNLPNDLADGIQLSGLSDAISEETKAFIKNIVFDDNGTFADLLTSKKSFAQHSGLAAIYDHPPATPQNPAEVGGRRQGVLMRSAFLGHDISRTSIINRGVNFQQRFLCNEIPSPNVEIQGDRDADSLTHDELLNSSNRQAVAHMTRSPVCMSCHSVINPTGFAFENFDAFGRIRDLEMIFDTDGSFVRNIAVDTSATVPFPEGRQVNVRDAYDLVTEVATEGIGAACMTRNIYRYFYEKVESPKDDCALEKVYKTVSSPNQSILQAFVDLIANEHIGEKVH